MTRVRRDVLSMVRPHFADLEPYVPIIPTNILAAQQGWAPQQIAKLDGNENPYGPSPKVLELLRDYRDYHIYPDPEQRELRPALAEYVGASPKQVIPGNGSDEIIDLLMRLFLDPGDGVINCSPSFGMYPFNTQVCAGTLLEVPRRGDFSLDLDGIANRAERSKLIFLTSPNNPTGNLLSRDELEAVLDTGLVVVVDEAYQEFASKPSFVPLVAEYENLVVLRTFSKWAGLAGLRVGYGVMSPDLVRLLDQMKPPYNVNVAALMAAKASLEDREYLLERVGWIVAERERLYQRLRALPYLDPLPSESNFILCRIDGRDGGKLKQGMEVHGVYVKRVNTSATGDCLRISVGMPRHTDMVIQALEAL